MRILRRLSAALAAAGLLSPGPSFAYQTPPPETLHLLMSSPQPHSWGKWILDSTAVRPTPVPPPYPPVLPYTGIQVTRRIDYDGANCRTPIQIAQFYHTAALPDPDDVAGTKSFTVTFYPDQAKVVVTVETQPYVEGQRSTRIFKYDYPLLDPVRFTPAYQFDTPMSFNACVPGRIYAINASVLADPYNSLVQLKLAGRPFPFVYLSPLKIGLGTTIFNHFRRADSGSVITGDTIGVADATPPRVGVYGFYWAYDSTPGHEFTRTNLMDDFNLNFGAKAFPVMSPTFRAGTAAPAMTAIVSPLSGTF